MIALRTDREARIYWLAAGLIAGGLVYLVKGFAALGFHPEILGTDMGHRLAGLDLIRAGGTPYGPPHVSSPEAPWGWLGNALVYGPPLPALRVYYLLLILAVMWLLWSWGYRVGIRFSRASGLLLAASTFAISSICTAVGVGQNSPFIVAALVASYLLAERKQRVLAGVCLGFALAKPQIGAPFVLPFLCTGEFLVLAAAAAYMTAATLAVCVLIGISPLEFIQGWFRFIGEMPSWSGYGPHRWLGDAGLPESTALAAAAIIVGVAALWTIWVLRHRPRIVLFAIAAVAARLWSYHQLYDNVMLVFVLIAAGELAAGSRDWRATATFAAVGLSIWLPGRFCDFAVFQWFQMLVWMAGAGVIATTFPQGGSRRDALLTSPVPAT